MAAACHNIVSMILDPLVTALNTWPEYKLVILGYSLGLDEQVHRSWIKFFKHHKNQNITNRLADVVHMAFDCSPFMIGAGVAQLITIDLTQGPNAERIPNTTQVLCVTFGAPPVYTHNTPGFTLPNLIRLVC